MTQNGEEMLRNSYRNACNRIACSYSRLWQVACISPTVGRKFEHFKSCMGLTTDIEKCDSMQGLLKEVWQYMEE